METRRPRSGGPDRSVGSGRGKTIQGPADYTPATKKESKTFSRNTMKFLE